MKNTKGIKKSKWPYFVVLAIVLSLGYYMYLSNEDSATPAETFSEVSEIGKVINKDLDTDYPNTPRKVILYYSQITKILYAESYQDETLIKLIDQSRKLFDEELLSQNSDDNFLKETKDVIKEFKEAGRKISDYVVEGSSSTEYIKIDDKECARVSVKYFLVEKSGYSKTYEDFILRKDADGRWKILGWTLIPAGEKDDD